ncbi:hypothetical protein FOXYSP1_06724 [Fusarium oxysporum f. sp. phaseoli]
MGTLSTHFASYCYTKMRVFGTVRMHTLSSLLHRTMFHLGLESFLVLGHNLQLLSQRCFSRIWR